MMGDLERRWPLLRRWALDSGRDVYDVTRASIVLAEARAGAGFFAALFLLDFWQAAPVSAAGPWATMMEAARLWWRMDGVFLQALILAGMAAVGAAEGILVHNAWVGLSHFWPASDPFRFRPALRGACAAVGVFFLHAAFFSMSVHDWPAIYQVLYGARGTWLSFQLFLSGGGAWFRGILFLPAALILGLALLRLGERFLLWLHSFDRATRVALSVAAGALIFFGAGLWAVTRIQADRNDGPNLILIGVEGLSADFLSAPAGGRSPAPRLRSLARLGRTYLSCRAPSSASSASLATLFSGQSPLVHGFRDDFPSALDLRYRPILWTQLLRQGGYVTAAVSSGGGEWLRRVTGDFDRVRAPSANLRARFWERALERHGHFLPYAVGVGAFFSPPGFWEAPFLSAPAREAALVRRWLGGFRFQKRFFLYVHFPQLSSPRALTDGVLRDVPASLRSSILRNPESSRSREALAAANLHQIDRAVAAIQKDVERRGLGESTWLAVVSLPSSDDGPSPLWDVRQDGGPLILVDPKARAAHRWVRFGVGLEDVGPTLLSLLKVPVPDTMEGEILDGTENPRLFFDRPYYREADPRPGPEKNGFSPRAAWRDILEEDPLAPGFLRIKAAQEDAIRVVKERLMQVGSERLIYRPTARGVVFEFYDVEKDTACRVNLAAAPAGALRVKTLKEIFYRCMARESGWRPQNDYWIPEAMLREDPSP